MPKHDRGLRGAYTGSEETHPRERSATSISPRFTSTDLEGLPDVDGVRYEIIDGDLHVSKQPSWHHQYPCTHVVLALESWSLQTGLGTATIAPGLIFASDDDVAPDVAREFIK